MTPAERAINQREFFIHAGIIASGLIIYYAVRDGDIAAIVFLAACILLLVAMIANDLIHRGQRKRARQTGVELARFVSPDGRP
jgi:hypothetical protein